MAAERTASPMRRQAWFRAYVGLGLAALVLTGSMLWGLHRLSIRDDIVFASESTGTWIAVQAELEYWRLLDAVERYGHGDPALDHDQLIQRFEIFWSRLPLILKGKEAELLRTIEGVPAKIEAMLAGIEALEPRLRTLQHGDFGSLHEIREALAPFGDTLHDLGTTAMLDSSARYLRQRINALFYRLATPLVGIVLSSALLIFLLLRQIQRGEKQASAYQESERRLAQAEQLAHLGTWEWNISSGGYVWSDETARILDLPSGTRASHETFKRALHPEDRTRVLATIDSAFQTGGRYALEFRIVRPNGAVRHVQSLGEIVRGPDGQVLRDFGTVQDITERKTAEARLRDALESMAEGAALFDSEDRLTLFNSRFANPVYGLDRAIRPGMTFEEVARASARASLYHPLMGDAEAWIQKRLELHRGAPSRHEQHYADGRWIEIHEYPTHDGGIFLVRTDITERKAAEQALSESRALLRAVIDALPAMVSAKDRDSRYVFMNRYQADLYNVTPEGAVGKSATSILGAEYGARTETLDRQVLATGEPTPYYEGEWTDAFGKQYFLLTRKVPLRDARGEVANVVTVSLDITDRRRAEAELARSEERFRRYFDLGLVGMAVASPDQRYVEVNDHLCHITGYSKKELLEMRWSDITHPDDISRNLMAHNRMVNGHLDGLSLDKRYIRKDGSIAHVIVSIRSLPGADRFPELMLAVVQDVTEQKKTEAALADAMREAELANRAKTNFLAAMSHELRTPLNSIIGFSEVLAGETFGPIGHARYREYIRDIEAAGRHLLDLINEILDISRIETGRLALEERLVDVPRLVTGCLHLVGERAQASGIVLQSNVAKALPALRADEVRVKQIVLNLLSNAIKFTPRGGTVSVGVALNGEDSFELTVSDTGQGIAADKLVGVLSPFAQAEDVLTRPHAGAGIGLPLSKRLAELHGGSLDLESRQGAGTTVRIRFPKDRTVRLS
ncbi:MAG: PAS domain S-box protein [Rhodospirillales bacterium]|nr:PAS domain S-box protein [Rhodospirillales bacterium]